MLVMAMPTLCVKVVAEYFVDTIEAPPLHMDTVLARKTPLRSKKEDVNAEVPLLCEPRSNFSCRDLPSLLMV